MTLAVRETTRDDATKTDSHAVGLLLLVVIATSLFAYLHTLTKLAIESRFIDFAHYYTYAKVVALGWNPFDPHAVVSVDALLEIRRAQAPANYPPLFYLIMQPWACLPFRTAALGWLSMSQLFLMGSVGFLYHRLVTASILRVACTIFVYLTFQPLIEDLALGQVNTLLLFLVSLGWWACQTGRPWLAALALASAPFLKVQYFLLMPFLWWAGFHSVLVRALTLMLGGLGVGLLVLGPSHHLLYLQEVFSLSDTFYARTTNLAMKGILLRLLGVTEAGTLLASALTLAFDILLVILIARAIPRPLCPASPGTDWAWGLGVTAIPLLSPFTEEHHLVILLLPLSLLLLGGAVHNTKARDYFLPVAAVVLIGGRYSLEQFPVFHSGIPSLLATGKTIGAAILAWTLFRRLRAATPPRVCRA